MPDSQEGEQLREAIERVFDARQVSDFYDAGFGLRGAYTEVRDELLSAVGPLFESLRHQLTTLQARVVDLEQALAFYADASDGGEVARTILNSKPTAESHTRHERTSR
jgi:hypothetical protein